MSSIDRNWGDEEWSSDVLAADDRPRIARRLGMSQETYDEASGDRYVYDAETGGWS